jgi:ribonuclease HII
MFAGIDEAGRGPVIGPLVICVAAMEADKEKILKDMGVKDSKLLSEKQRESILKNMEKLVKYKIVIIHPKEIDASVQDNRLNYLEADKGAMLLNELSKEFKISKTIIDCPSTNISAYKEYFQSKLNHPTELVVEHKADLHHIIVGAASIIAKVTREKELEKLKKRFNIDFGSGYPADPKTKDFLEKNHSNLKYSEIFRKSWATFRKFDQKSLEDF